MDNPWEPSGVAAADSLFARYWQMKISTRYSRTDIKMMADSFCSVAARHPENDLLRLRGLYARGSELMRTDMAGASRLLREEMHQEDSAKHPYEWHWLRTLRLKNEKGLFNRYTQASENASYFDAVGSILGKGRNYELLGGILYDMGDIDRSMEYYDKAIGQYDAAGATRQKFVVEMSKTAAMKPHADSAVFNRLLNDSIVRCDRALYASVLYNAYISHSSPEMLRKAIAILEEEELDRGDLPVLLCARAHEELYAGHLDSALLTLEQMKEECRKVSPPARRQEVIHATMAEVYAAAGMPDDAIGELCQVVFWNDSSYREANLPKVYAAETHKLIEIENKNAALERQRIVMWWILSVLTIVLVAGATVHVFRKRHAANVFEMKLLEEKIDSAYRLHLAQSTALEENRRLISEIETAMESSQNAPSGKSNLTADLKRVIALHQSNEVNRQGLVKISRELDGLFASRLKKDFPDLSESLLRLAQLIAAGVDSHQLSSILNISSKSLYTSRYRLRARLGLAKEDSLEDFLRKYRSPESSQSS